jgi:hypothetical protein
MRGHQVVDVDHRAITMAARTSSRLKVYRGDGDEGSVLVWRALSTRNAKRDELTAPKEP